MNTYNEYTLQLKDVAKLAEPFKRELYDLCAGDLEVGHNVCVNVYCDDNNVIKHMDLSSRPVQDLMDMGITWYLDPTDIMHSL